MAQELLDVVGGLEDGSEEDNARVGVATEDVDNAELEGDLPLTTSGIADIEGVSQPGQLKALQHISLWKDDKMINVLTGNNILNEETLSRRTSPRRFRRCFLGALANISTIDARASLD